jgi:glycerol uptake facilitator-like aquaporin
MSSTSKTTISAGERFWIAFILRFAFGFLFLFAAINIFNYGDARFAEDLSAPMAGTWIGDVEAQLVSLAKGIDIEDASRDGLLVGFLRGLPYVMCALATCILTGILLKPALRLGALVMILLGLGKYLTNDIATTAQDFFFAFMICVGLYFLGLERAEPQGRQAAGEVPA